MVRLSRSLPVAFCLAGLAVAGGCDSMSKRKEQGRLSDPAEISTLDGSDDSPVKAGTEKFFHNNRLSGGLSDQAREIERDFGIQ